MPNTPDRPDPGLHDGDSRWLFVIPSALLLGLFAMPLAAVILRSISPDFLKNAFSEQALDALSLSLSTSSVTMIVAAVFGTPLAYVMSRWTFKHKAWLEILLDLPIVLPPSVAGLALLIAFGRNGLFGSALGTLGISLPFTTVAVVIAQTFVAAPLYVRSARIGFAEIDHQII